VIKIFENKQILLAVLAAILLRLLIIFLFLGHGDLDNGSGFVENLNSQQDPLGMPYPIFSHIFPYYFADLFKFLNFNFSQGLRILTLASEVLLVISIHRLKIIKLKYLIYFIALNPFLILYTGLQGQIDLWAIAFTLLAISEANKNRILRAAFLFSLACLIKPMVIISIFFFFNKNIKDNFNFLIIFSLTFIFPFLLTFNFYIILKNIFIIFSYMTASKNETHIAWFLTDFTNTYSLILIIFSIFFLKLYIKKTSDQFILILPIVLLMKGGLSSQYFSWLIPLLIFNYKLGIISSFIFSMNYILSYFLPFFKTGSLVNSNAFALNNNLIGNNMVLIPFDDVSFNILYQIFSNISLFLILANIIYFIYRGQKKNV